MPNRKLAREWTPTYVKRLWDWYAQNPHLQHLYFTSQLGDGIIRFLEFTGKLKGKVLDYGCGAGHLIERLLRKETLECYGVDLSSQSIAVLEKRFRGHSRWKGGRVIEEARTDFEDHFFDVVICVETLEHLPDALVEPVLSELRRLIKPGGLALITSPCHENLEEDLIYCPFCDSEFHKWQHMRSLTVESLKALLIGVGFKVEFCAGLDLGQFQKDFTLSRWARISLSDLRDWFLNRLRNAKDNLLGPHDMGSSDFQYRLKRGVARHLCALVSK